MAKAKRVKQIQATCPACGTIIGVDKDGNVTAYASTEGPAPKPEPEPTPEPETPAPDDPQDQDEDDFFGGW